MLSVLSWVNFFLFREVMFHVSTLLPFSSGDHQQVQQEKLIVLQQWIKVNPLFCLRRMLHVHVMHFNLNGLMYMYF